MLSQAFFIALHKILGNVSQTGRLKQDKLHSSTIPPLDEAHRANCRLSIHTKEKNSGAPSPSPLPHIFHPSISALRPPLPPPAAAGVSWDHGRRGRALLSFHFLSLLCCGFAGSRDEEALADSQQPVQAVPGAVDEDSQCLPALFCPLHQAQ